MCPLAPKRPCLTPKCHGFAEVRGRCRACNHARYAGRAREQGPVYDRAWRVLSAQVRAEEPVCYVPGCGAPTEAADHIKPVATHPALRLVRSNLRGTCWSHHSQKTNAEDGGLGRARLA